MKTIGQLMFTDKEAPGAIRNGTSIMKVAGDPQDLHPIGTRGKVLGSIGIHGIYGYFIEWSPRPGVPVFVAGYKIGVAQ